MAESLNVVEDGIAYAAAVRSLSADELELVLSAWRLQLENHDEQGLSRLGLACNHWPWASFTQRKTKKVFGLWAKDLSGDCLGLLAADEDGRMRRGGLCVSVHYLSKSPEAFATGVRLVGSCLVASALRWSQEVGFSGRATIPFALGSHPENPRDDPSAAYARMGFVATAYAQGGVSWVEMEISERDAESFIRRLNDGERRSGYGDGT